MKQFYPKIVQIIYKILEAFKARDNIVNTLNDLYNFILSISDLNTNCRISNLVKELSSFAYGVGEVKFVYRLVINHKQLKDNFSGLITHFYVSDYRMAGVAFGKITTILLNFSTK